MTLQERIDFIDDFLSNQENFLHGKDGEDCTLSRKYLSEIQNQIK